jgi:ribosome-binding protein aMBF1 (putative translation factor)
VLGNWCQSAALPYEQSAARTIGLLDITNDTGTLDSMSKRKPTITEVLRAAIERSGVTRYRIAKESRISESNLRRFVQGEMSIRLDNADKLAAYLGLRLTPDPDAAPPEPTPENLARPMLAKTKSKRKAK